jgi:hypothetical protein
MKPARTMLMVVALAGFLTVVFVGGLTEVASRLWPGDEEIGQPCPEVAPLRILAKDQIAREVGEGRRSLLEAAKLFGQLNKLDPAMTRVTEVASSVGIPADTEEACLCRQVVAYVLHQKPDPSRAAVAMARLDAEF